MKGYTWRLFAFIIHHIAFIMILIIGTISNFDFSLLLLPFVEFTCSRYGCTTTNPTEKFGVFVFSKLKVYFVILEQVSSDSVVAHLNMCFSLINFLVKFGTNSACLFFFTEVSWVKMICHANDMRVHLVNVTFGSGSMNEPKWSNFVLSNTFTFILELE